MKRNLESKLERHVPPGFDLKLDLIAYSIWIIMQILVSFFRFFSRFDQAYTNLFAYEDGVKILLADARMIEFATLIRGVGSAYFVLAFIVVRRHYLYFTKDTKSIYLMKRLPKYWERDRRCWALPLTYMLATFLVSVLLKSLFLWVYLHYTPAGSLPPDQVLNIWSVIL